MNNLIKDKFFYIKQYFENLYDKYNHREFVHPDPLEFLYKYKEQRDIEIMGLLASSLAYGRVEQILKSVSKIEKIFNFKPYNYIKNGNLEQFKEDLKDFKHRFTKGIDYAKYLNGIRLALKDYKTIEALFMDTYDTNDTTLHPALSKFYKKLSLYANSDLKNIFPNPDKNSACKRSYLFLRWMIRKDSIDLGLWDNTLSSKLLIPLDTHVLDIAVALGFISKKQNNIKTAMLVSSSLKKINKLDPIKYDFALTRPGIRNEEELDFLKNLENLSTKQKNNEKKYINNTNNTQELSELNKGRKLL